MRKCLEDITNYISISKYAKFELQMNQTDYAKRIWNIALAYKENQYISQNLIYRYISQ